MNRKQPTQPWESREKLTKAFLMLAPAGKYLVSNTGNPPTFAEVIAPLRERGGQWKRIVAAKVNGKLCMVFTTEAAWREFVRSITGGSDLN